MPDTTNTFSCAVVERREAVHVCPAGELDLSTVPEVDARLAEVHLAGFDKIVLDLSRVTFFDSCGVHLVMRWARRAADERFEFAVIVGSDVVERVLQLTGVKRHLLDSAHGGRLTEDPPPDHETDCFHHRTSSDMCGGASPDPTP